MKVPYEWLQSYFKEKLPAPEKLTELLTFHLAEVETVEHTGEDTVYDIKILPDRACYALSVRGVARELAAILDMTFLEEPVAGIKVSDIPDPAIAIVEPGLCSKFVSRRMTDLQVGDSPEWLARRLKAVGQRPINNLVDATNYMMFGLGRPMHVFDADKVRGTLTVRRAQKGETLVTLDNKHLDLENGELIVADEEGPLGLAGIKGGKRAEAGLDTRNVILEAANWDPVNIRRTAASTGIRTEASKRFENRLSPFLAEEGIERITALLMDTASTGATQAGRPFAVSFEDVKERRLMVDPAKIARKLGIAIEGRAVEDILRRLAISCERQGDELMLRVPFDRLDLEIADDIVEEVGRIIGYDKIPLVLPPKPPAALRTPKSFYWEWKAREILVSEGFSEIMTSSFSEKGEIAIAKPLAKDKKFCRPDLRGSFAPALAANALNAPLFGSDEVRIFEIGKVFPKEGERTALAIGYAGPKQKVAKVLGTAVEKLSAGFATPLRGEVKEGVFECDLDALIEALPDPEKWDIHVPAAASDRFAPFSRYPFVARDIALFVPAGTDGEAILALTRAEGGQLASRAWKFDEFEKDGKRSLAFRVVFQSPERTLTDGEVNAVMEKIYAALKTKFGAEIR